MTCETRFMLENFAEYSIFLFEPLGQQYFPFFNATRKNRQEVFIPTSKQFYVDLDCGPSCVCDFFAMIGPLDETFGLSETATITLQANNIYDFTTPAFSQLIPFDSRGAMSFFDGINMGYRYYRILVDDSLSPYPVTNIKIGNIYIGPYVSIPSKTIAQGFAYRRVDRSRRIETEGAATFYSIKNSFRALEGMVLEFIQTDYKNLLDQIVMDIGTHKPFYLSVDSGGISETLNDLTMYSVFDTDPIISHIRANYWAFNFNVREV